MDNIYIVSYEIITTNGIDTHEKHCCDSTETSKVLFNKLKKIGKEIIDKCSCTLTMIEEDTENSFVYSDGGYGNYFILKIFKKPIFTMEDI